MINVFLVTVLLWAISLPAFAGNGSTAGQASNRMESSGHGNGSTAVRSIKDVKGTCVNNTVKE